MTTSTRKHHVDGDLQRAYWSLHQARQNGTPDDVEFWVEAWEYEQQQARVHGYTDAMIQEAVDKLAGVGDDH